MNLLPLSLGGGLEGLQDLHNPLQSLNLAAQTSRHASLNLRVHLIILVISGLGVLIVNLAVEGSTVGAEAHGSAEDTLDNEVVVGLEGGAVSLVEGNGELGGGVVEVVAESLNGEIEATIEKKRSVFSCTIDMQWIVCIGQE